MSQVIPEIIPACSDTLANIVLGRCEKISGFIGFWGSLASLLSAVMATLGFFLLLRFKRASVNNHYKENLLSRIDDLIRLPPDSDINEEGVAKIKKIIEMTRNQYAVPDKIGQYLYFAGITERTLRYLTNELNRNSQFGDMCVHLIALRKVVE